MTQESQDFLKTAPWWALPPRHPPLQIIVAGTRPDPRCSVRRREEWPRGLTSRRSSSNKPATASGDATIAAPGAWFAA